MGIISFWADLLLAGMYKCTGRAVALPQVAALALAVASALPNVQVFCDRQGIVKRIILYVTGLVNGWSEKGKQKVLVLAQFSILQFYYILVLLVVHSGVRSHGVGKRRYCGS